MNLSDTLEKGTAWLGRKLLQGSEAEGSFKDDFHSVGMTGIKQMATTGGFTVDSSSTSERTVRE